MQPPQRSLNAVQEIILTIKKLYMHCTGSVLLGEVNTTLMRHLVSVDAFSPIQTSTKSEKPRTKRLHFVVFAHLTFFLLARRRPCAL